MLDVLTFNNKSLADFDTFFDGSQLFVTPDKDVTLYSIPGRNGDLTISNERFMNIDVNVNCFIRQRFRENYSALINYLSSQDGYGRLESTKEPDVYRMANFIKGIEPSTGAFLHSGQFTLVFNCMPQKYLKSGEKAVSVSGSTSLNNPTSFIAKPLILVTGIGSFTVNGVTLTLSANTSKVYVDCEIQDAYEGTINRNNNLSAPNGFPTLVPGSNSVSVSGCTIEIIPRWWRL